MEIGIGDGLLGFSSGEDLWLQACVGVGISFQDRAGVGLICRAAAVVGDKRSVVEQRRRCGPGNRRLDPTKWSPLPSFGRTAANGVTTAPPPIRNQPLRLAAEANPSRFVVGVARGGAARY